MNHQNRYQKYTKQQAERSGQYVYWSESRCPLCRSNWFLTRSPGVCHQCNKERANHRKYKKKLGEELVNRAECRRKAEQLREDMQLRNIEAGLLF